MNHKCLFIIDRLIRFAGTEKHLFQVTSHLNKQIFKTKVIAFEADPKIAQSFIRNNVSVTSLALPKMYGVDALRKFFKLVRELRSYNPDIVQTFHFKSDTFGVLAAKIAGCRSIVSNRRDMGHLKTERQLRINRIMNRMIKYYIAVCGRVKNSMVNFESIPEEKIWTVYNGVELTHFENEMVNKQLMREKHEIEQDAIIVGTVCILRIEKDVGLFISAIAELCKRHKNIIGLVVGDGPCKKDLMRLAQDLNITEKIIFTGYQTDIREYVNIMDIACLTPKENEGLSNSLLEKMAMRKPVIATDVGGNAEVVIHGKTGFIIPPGDKISLIKYLNIMVKDQKLRITMGRAGRKRVEEFFSIDYMVKNLEEIYLTFVNSARMNKI